MVSEKTISFDYKANYHELTNGSEDQLIIVLHGYGQLASYFIRKFQFLHSQGWHIAAPGGLSRFYLKGFSGRVGATWMTKENRLLDIENYIAYLNSLYQQLLSQRKYKKIVLLGFSQGAATAARWITQSDKHFDALLLWAGIFPPDLDMKQSFEKLQNIPVHITWGKQDPFIKQSRLDEMQQIISQLNIQPKLHQFEGEHDINQACLESILKEMD